MRYHKRLLPMLLFTNLLVLVRFIYTGKGAFLFIPWNLLLAAAPLYFGYVFCTTKNVLATWVFFVIWLLFFPNSIYIVTDLFHLKTRPEMPEWYDLLILFTAALNGLIIGFLSLRDVERYLRRRIGRRLVLVQLTLFFLSGYGIYLGRYLRWNSWDLVANPFSLFRDIIQDVIHPLRNKECWLMSIVFGVWLYILYSFFRNYKAGHTI